MLTQQSMIHGKYHGKTSYLLGNIDAGIQEFAGTGYCADDVQTMQTVELQMMMSHGSHTKQLHKSITQTNHTKDCTRQDDITSKNGNDEQHFRCSRATQVHMEDLRLVNLTEKCPS